VTVKTTVKVTEGEVVQTAAITRKWDIDGVTTTAPDMECFKIAVTLGDRHIPGTVKVVVGHEVGHASFNQDIRDGYERVEDAFQTLKLQDRWDTEIEAWLRGERITTLTQGQLMFDALNSYRRALGTDDDTWYETREVLLETIVAAKWRDPLRDYIPLEPDPNDAPPECGEYREISDAEMQDGDEIDPEDGWNPPEDYDYDDEDDRTYEALPVKTDSDWLDQDVIEAIQNGEALQAIIDQHGLDAWKMPPLIKALVKAREM
jgi:hypothetical protein